MKTAKVVKAEIEYLFFFVRKKEELTVIFLSTTFLAGSCSILWLEATTEGVLQKDCS